MAERVQLRRTKGWRKPEGVIVVGWPSQWGNPFTVAGARENWLSASTSDTDARRFVVECFRDWLTKGERSEWWFEHGRGRWYHMTARLRRQLAGHDLGCWCPLGQPCHADVLLEVANDCGPEDGTVDPVNPETLPIVEGD